MFRAKRVVGVIAFLFYLSASIAYAQYPVVGAEDVKSRLSGSKKVMIIDTRLPDEYQSGHIPGAVNIPAERVRIEAAKLPKDRSMSMIFYCRGAG